MFTDSIVLSLSAGRGGNGVVAWRREKYIPKGGPSGGNGGRGGSIVLKADTQVLSLQAYRNYRIIQAENGLAGGSSLKQGKTGKDLVLKVPCGTLVKDAKTGDLLFDFTDDGQEWIVCKGGRGGMGNNCFKSPTHQAPNVCTEGTEGQKRELEFELKLIADVGLVGFPNAGKSTLMHAVTHVPVKIAPYPFTTLYPNLGYIQFPDYSRTLIADIPGIIKDAHKDKGLGISFLKHIERSSTLIYLLDASGMEERDPVEDFRILRKELGAYRKDLLEKRFFVVLNKIDSDAAELQVKRFRKKYTFDPQTLFAVSALRRQGLEPLIQALQLPLQR